MSKLTILLIFSFLLSGVSKIDAGDAAGPAIKRDVQQTIRLIDGIRGKALSTLLNLERKYRKGDRHAAIMIRIAELYYEKSKAAEANEIRTFNARRDEYGKTKKGKMPVLNRSRSRKYIYSSIETYERFIAKYPEQDLIDRAIFNLAFNYKELGIMGKALRYFHRLIKEQPLSPLIPDACLNIAEYHFDHNDWDNAKIYYEKAAGFRNTKIYGYTLYKLAWTNYNLKDYLQAMTGLEEVVAHGRNPLLEQNRSKIDLVKESLKDLVLFYSETGERALARKYFFRIGGKEDYIWMLERLAKIYITNGDHRNAIAVYAGIIDVDRNSEKNPEWTLAIVESYATIENTSPMLQNLHNLVVNYRKGTGWWKYHRDNPDLIKKSYEIRESTLRRYAKKYHKIARKQRRSRHFDIATELYAKYLKYFAEDSHSYELRYFYAELFFEREKYLNAARHYAFVRDDMRSKKYREKAASNVVLSYDNRIKDYEYILASNTGSKRSIARKINKVEELQIVACDKYVEHVPKGKKLIEMKFKAARLLYRHRKYKEARPRFAHIAETYPKHKNAVFSVHLMLDSFNVVKDWFGLNEWARHFYANEQIMKHEKMGEELYRLIVDSAFKICLVHEKEKKYRLAADKFHEFSLEFPDHKLSRDAILNSARNYTNADNLVLAIDMQKKFIQHYQNDIEVKNTIKNLAVNYEKIGYISVSASYYSRFVKMYPNDSDTEKALYNIAYFHDLAGNFAKAEDQYLTFLQRYPRSSFAAEGIDALSDIAERTDNFQKEARYLQMYVAATGAKPDRVIRAHLRLGKIAASSGNFRESNQHYKNTLKYFHSKKKREFVLGKSCAAEATFLLADMYFPKFQAIRLTLPREKMVGQISKKIKVMQDMNSAYSKVFDYGATKFAIAALYKIGLSYEEFSRALLKAPMPKDLTTKEIQEFKTELERVAFPIEEKAISSFEANIEKASELRLGMEWAKLSYEKMYKYRPKEYPLEMFESGFKFLESGTIYKVD